MLKKITNNLGLKIVSLFITVVLWVVAININDPVGHVTYTVPVVIENHSDSKYMEVVDNTDQVKVTVRAKRSVLANISEKNILATANFDKMTEGGYIPIELNTQKTSEHVDSLKIDDGYVHVNVENIIENTHFISSEIIGQTADGYLVASATLAKSRARVEGPESVVSKVKTVKAYIDVDGVSSDVNDSAKLILLDAEGNLIDDERVKVNPAEVSTSATIYLTKEITVVYEVEVNLPDGYEQDGVTEYNIEKVWVQGKPRVIEGLERITVTRVIDLTESKKSGDTLMHLKDFLPEGVAFYDNTYDNAKATVNIKEIVIEEEEKDQEE